MVLNMTKGIYGQINLHLQCVRNAAKIQYPRRCRWAEIIWAFSLFGLTGYQLIQSDFNSN
jgi:hypothetical protein